MRVMKTLTINGKTYRVVSDWKDLENRPVQEVPSDTLKWDGDHTGLEKYAGDVSTYKVSDSVPTEADLANGFTIEVQSYGSIQTTTHNDGSFTATGEGALHYGSVVCIINETAAATLGVSAGVYFMRDDSQLYVRSFTIAGYTGFLKDMIDPEYLPDIEADMVQMSENVRLSDLFVTKVPIFEEQDISGFAEQSNSMWLVELPVVLTLTEGAAFMVIWDGVTYSCTECSEIKGSVTISGGSYLGNGAAFMEGLPDTGEPFFIMAGTEGTVFVTKEAGESHNVGIILDGQINPVYLPPAESGGAETPVFDLVAMGLPTITLDGTDVELETDATEILTALSKGTVVFKVNAADGETTIPIDLVGTNVYIEGDGVAVVICPMAMAELGFFMLQVMAAGIAAAYMPHSMIAGPAGVSSWNDLTDKPFYEEGNREVLFEEMTLDGFVHNSTFGLYFTYTTKPFSLVVGETYTVLWDGEEYVVTAQDASTLNDGAEMIAIGNGTAFGMSGNNEPFIIATDVSNMFFFAADPSDATASHNVGIFQGAVTVKTLDEKYLPMDAIDARIEEYISSALEGDY